MSPERADLVVVGGGIMGMSVAYQVARRSSLRVVVLEKGVGLGEGSTGASSAIIRQRYTHPEMVRLTRHANVVFHHWAEYVGLARPRARLRETGVLWIFDEDPVAVAADRDRLVAEGVDAVVLAAGEVREAFPALTACVSPFDLGGERPHDCRDGVAFLLERDGGYFDPTGALEDLAEAARRVGVDVRLRAEVVAVHVVADRVTGVSLADGTRLDAGVVVNAAGPWCNRINAMAGLELPWRLVPTRIQVLHRELPSAVPRPLPVAADGSTGIYFRPEAADQQILMGSVLEEDEREAVDPDGYVRVADRAFLDRKIHALHHRIPALPHRGRVQGMAGLYTVNRDDVHPVLGPSPIDGFVLCNGFSGHGFKESPMVGALLARWLTGESAEYDTDVPLEFFAVDRTPLTTESGGVLA